MTSLLPRDADGYKYPQTTVNPPSGFTALEWPAGRTLTVSGPVWVSTRDAITIFSGDQVIASWADAWGNPRCINSGPGASLTYTLIAMSTITQLKVIVWGFQAQTQTTPVPPPNVGNWAMPGAASFGSTVGSNAITIANSPGYSVNYGAPTQGYSVYAVSYMADGGGSYIYSSSAGGPVSGVNAACIASVAFTMQNYGASAPSAYVNAGSHTLYLENVNSGVPTNPSYLSLSGFSVDESTPHECTPGNGEIGTWSYDFYESVGALTNTQPNPCNLQAFYPAPSGSTASFGSGVTDLTGLSISDQNASAAGTAAVIVNYLLYTWQANQIPYPNAVPYLPESVAGYTTTWIL